MNSEELKKIYASAPVSSTPFEVVSITAPWFSQTYHLQNVMTEAIQVTLETSEVVTVNYAPMNVGEASSNADLNYERNIVFQMVNDILAAEQSNFDPDIHDPRDQKVQSRGYIYYRTGDISSLQTSVTTTYVRDITRDSESGSANVRISSKPSNESATGEVATVTRVPMLRGFI